MNERDELRVIETLRAYTGGLIVTEQDILSASNRMRSSLEPRSPRRRPLLIAVAAVFVLIIGVVTFQTITGDEKSAPPPADQPSASDRLEAALDADAYTPFEADFLAGTPPTAQSLAGIWLLRFPYESPLMVNGKLEWSRFSLKDERAFGTSTLDEGTWTRNPPSDFAPECTPTSWTSSTAGDGSLHLLFASGTNSCTPADSYEVWDRLAPGPSPVLDYLRETSADIEWAAPTGSNLAGMYINTESGHLLEIWENGRYWYFDSVTGQEFAPSDKGRLDLETAGTVAGSCGDGSFSSTVEVGMTAAVADYLKSYPAMRFNATGDSCSRSVGADGVWVNIYSG